MWQRHPLLRHGLQKAELKTLKSLRSTGIQIGDEVYFLFAVWFSELGPLFRLP